jgi:membrane-bound lytic murein transglycosylase D
MKPSAWLRVVAACSLSVVAGCGLGQKAQLPVLPPPSDTAQEPAHAPAAPAEPADPVTELIAGAERHFQQGQAEYAVGHLEQAKLAFDLAVDLLLTAPGGAHGDARLGEYFDRLVDRINALELTALAQGDGFTEQQSEPAMIDELLEESTFPLPAAGASTVEAVEHDLPLHDIPIEPVPKVLSYVELFQGRLRDWFQESLQRGMRYLPMIQSVFREEGVPLDLAYVPVVESAFKPNALSRARAKGVWQFMRGTAVENGLRYDWYVDERADPEKATQAAAKYLHSLSEMFDGDWQLALASYNGGPGRVERAIKRARTDDFWELSASSRYLPRETREYVPMILAAIIIARNPSQYGFTLDAAPPLEYEKATLPVPVDLRRVAEWTGTTVDVIQDLNPELRRWTTPLKDDAYEIKVPTGTGAQLVDRIEHAAPGELIAVSEYVVRRGDTLSGIAKRLKVSWQDVADANNLTKRSIIRPGQRLLVPRAPAALLAARSQPASARAAASSSRPDRVIYRVRRGDTLSKIARAFDTTVSAIKGWNNLTSSRIKAGDRLTIYPNQTSQQ